MISIIKTNGTLASTTRSWERIKNYNVGVDFGFLNGSLTGSVEAFMKQNNNMLVSVTFPGTLGDSAPKANAGKFKGWGYEGQLNYRNRIGDVNYHIGGTFTFARNELVDYGGTTVLKSGYVQTQQGYPLNSIFGLRYGGKIQNEEQLAAYKTKYYNNNGIGMPSNLRVGDNMYCDENGLLVCRCDECGRSGIWIAVYVCRMVYLGGYHKIPFLCLYYCKCFCLFRLYGRWWFHCCRKGFYGCCGKQ